MIENSVNLQLDISLKNSDVCFLRRVLELTEPTKESTPKFIEKHQNLTAIVQNYFSKEV